GIHARRREGSDPRARRQGGRERVEEDRLRGRRTGRGIEGDQGARARPDDPRRGAVRAVARPWTLWAGRHVSVEVRRAASDAEIAAAGEITAQAYQADRLIDPDDAYLDELADARRRAREAILLVATLPGARPDSPDVVVGTITMAPPGTSYAETAEPGELELRMLAVAPEARGKGVAEAL